TAEPPTPLLPNHEPPAPPFAEAVPAPPLPAMRLNLAPTPPVNPPPVAAAPVPPCTYTIRSAAVPLPKGVLPCTDSTPVVVAVMAGLSPIARKPRAVRNASPIVAFFQT